MRARARAHAPIYAPTHAPTYVALHAPPPLPSFLLVLIGASLLIVQAMISSAFAELQAFASPMIFHSLLVSGLCPLARFCLLPSAPSRHTQWDK